MRQVQLPPIPTQWERDVTQLLNRVLAGLDPIHLDADPVNVAESFSYWNTALKQNRQWDGTVWKVL
jgi:hypothetical protein